MPIQPMNLSAYSEVPEDEDVNPVDGPIEKRVRRSIKATIIIVLACVIAISATVYAGFTSIYKTSSHVQIFQTSKSFHDQLTELNPWSLFRRGFLVTYIGFGNVQCTNKVDIEKGDYRCDDKSTASRIIIDTSKTYQSVLGFGGAFTEASAVNFYKLPSRVQEKIIQLYFGPNGIQFTLGRIHIGSCDFCLESYSFDDVAGDYNMDFFDDDVTHDQSQIIPMIKRAMAASPNTINLLASPWSPPAWMKVPVNGTQSMLSSADPSGLIADPRIQSAWAKYISKFITSYAKSGVPIWALTPQNEPEFAAPWEACKYNSSFESDFVNNYLGPIVKGDHPEILILAYDHNKDLLKQWTDTIMSNNEQNYFDGMAFHWYMYNEDRYLDGSYGYDAVNYTYHAVPNKILLATEGCSCPGVLIDNWLRAERLAHDIIFDMLNYAQGWIDWNLIVDREGGPNHLGNECDASIVCLEDFSDVHVQPKFYFFGHFSKFVHPGDLRVDSLIVGDYNFADVNVDVKYGTEVQIFPCERSTRQQWVYIPANKTLGLMKITTDGFSQWSRIINLCLASSGSVSRQYLKVDMCTNYVATGNVLHVEITSQGQIKDISTGYCVEVSDSNTVGGGLLQLSPCKDSSALNYIDQIWDFNHRTGELTTKHRGLCMTAGWPFLTGIAFMRETGMSARVTVIVMNEADISTEVVLTDTKHGKDLRFGISDRSIQTIIY